MIYDIIILKKYSLQQLVYLQDLYYPLFKSSEQYLVVKVRVKIYKCPFIIYNFASVLFKVTAFNSERYK